MLTLDRVSDTFTTLLGRIQTITPTWVLWVGLVSACLTGLALKWWVNTRRFGRRHPLYGIERFNSYADMLVSRFTEGVASIIANVGLIVGVGFVLLIGARYFLSGWSG